MGANCCVAARNKPSPGRLSCEVSNYRNIRHSPSWSFRWDNRTHIEDITNNPSRFSHSNSRNIGSEGKSAVDTETEGLSSGESPSYSLQTPKRWKKVGTAGNSRSVFADQSPRINSSPEGTCSFKPSSPANHSIAKPSTSPSSSSFKARHSHGGSSDGWSMRAFSELVATSSSHRGPPSQTCRVCSKLLKEKSPWSPQKIVASTNELSVTAVLACGHAFHAECLESVTLETDPYDPPCPICTHGENSIPRMVKSKSKISRRAVADIDFDLKSPSASASSSMKKPFLKRHFSIGGSRSGLEGEAARKKTGFWGRR